MSVAAVHVEEFNPSEQVIPIPNIDIDRIQCVVVDDDRFDRKLVSSIAARSRFSIDLQEATCIADARRLLLGGEKDLLIVDIGLPDGSGIDFAGELAADEVLGTIPVIFMTGAGSEKTAISALRLGAADYLAKNDLTTEVFDQAIENALRHSVARTLDRNNQLSTLSEESAAVRRIALRNMRLLKGQVLPLMSFAWRMLRGDQLSAEERLHAAKALSKITRQSTGLIDDTVIVAATHRVNMEAEAVDLRDLVQTIINEDLGEIALSRAHIRVRDLPVLMLHRAQIGMMFEELLLTAVRSAKLGATPEIELGAGQDVDGDPIIWLVENGLQLSARKQALSVQNADLANPQIGIGRDAHSWSLCQRIAEKNDGKFRIAETSDDRTKIMIRFPREKLVKPDDA